MKILIIDGNSIINRAYYGLPKLTNQEGLHTNGVYGFLNVMDRLLADQHPDGLAVAFDRKEPTFRHKMYDGYKATRSAMPEELAQQMPVMKQVLSAMNIPSIELPGYEADDILGTVAKDCQRRGMECVVVTGDRDSLQLVSPTTKVMLVRTKFGQTLTELYDVERFESEYGFQPRRLVDLKALMGDSSDNIPGVPGVGEKTAMALMASFGSLDGVYENINSPHIKDSVRKKLENGRESAYLSYTLAEICCQAPMDIQVSALERKDYNSDALYPLFVSLGFSKLIDKYGLKPGETEKAQRRELKISTLTDGKKALELLKKLESLPIVTLLASRELEEVALCHDGQVHLIFPSALGGERQEFLNCLFSDKIQKNAHGVKALMEGLISRGLPTEGFVFDTELAAYLLDPSAGGYGLDSLAMGYLKTELPQQEADSSDSLLADEDKLAQTLAARADGVDRLYALLKPRLEKEGMLELFNTIELPLCRVLAQMESLGFAVDRGELLSFGKTLGEGIDRLQQRIWELAGESFNINSTKQLGVILFERLGLPAVKKTKSGYSTNVDVLNKLRGKHEIIDLVMEYRTLTKLKSTYADGLAKVIGPDGRIRTSFNMTATATGRLSSTEPNLQNIPVRTELGSQIRKMFVPAKGKVLVDADYSQIELRVLAHIAGDEHMIAAFNSGEDVHSVTASQVFGVPLDEVSSVMRSRAKAVNFGIVYGISDFSLSEDIGVTRAEAKDYMESYLANYSGVARFMKQVVEDARETGYVTTMFGRKRWLPELKASNYNIRSGAERMAMNSPIQGTAADIIKLAMIRVHKALEDAGLQARLILQVHDELIVEAPEEEAPEVCRIVKEQMQSVVSLAVPLVAEAKAGKSWYEAK